VRRPVASVRESLPEQAWIGKTVAKQTLQRVLDHGGGQGA